MSDDRKPPLTPEGEAEQAAWEKRKAEIVDELRKPVPRLESVFICSVCGAHKVHYRMVGYRCKDRCEEMKRQKD